MNAFEAYNTYLSLKSHFSRDNYDYFKYNGKTNASVKAFESRRDKFHFYRLSKLPDDDIVDLVLSNIVYDDKHKWIGDLFTDAAKDRMLTRRQRQQSISYHFKGCLSALHDDFNSNLVVQDGDYPKLITLLRRDEISLESVVILCSVTGCMKHWDSRITDTIIWPNIRRKIVKYSHFVSFDKAKMKKIILEKFD